MNTEFTLESRFLRLKGYLTRIAHISYTFSKLSRILHGELSEDAKKAAVDEYEKLMADVLVIAKEYAEKK